MNRRSLEDTIRAVSQKYKNRPSPLAMMNHNVGMVPQQVSPPTTPSSKNIRNVLVGDFKPPQDVFR